MQPFTYEEEGYPDILELPFQFWLDVVWFDQHGYDTGPALLEALKGAVDEVAEHDLVYGACFHDWVMLASDERRVGWLRGFLRYAQRRGVEVTTYTDYWRSASTSGRAPSRAPCVPSASRAGCSPEHCAGLGRERPICQKAVSMRGKCGPWMGSPGAHSSSASV